MIDRREQKMTLDGDSKLLIGVIAFFIALVGCIGLGIEGNKDVTRDRNHAYVECVQLHTSAECKVARP